MAIEGIKNLIEDIEKVKQYSRDLLAKNAFSSLNPLHSSLSVGAPSPSDYLSYFKLVSDRLASPDGVEFIAKQGFLKSLNPQFGTGKLYNPLNMLLPPGAGGLITDFLESPDAQQNPGTRLAVQEDRLKALFEGRHTDLQRASSLSVNQQINDFKFPDGKTISEKNSENNLFDHENPSSRRDYFENILWNETGKPGRTTVNPAGVPYDIPNFEAMFEKKSVGPAFTDSQKGYLFFKPKTDGRTSTSEEVNLLRSALENKDTYTDADDFEKGYSENQYLDDAYYVPFYFEDLRRPERRIFFRAFINNFSEQFIPKWSQDEYFGRMDPVGNYKNTSRKIPLSFKIMPTSPAGFTAAWRKINNFIKMCFPTYKNGSMVRAPIVRMRIGDVICDVAGLGLPGYIESLELNYTDSIWETEVYTQSTGIELGKAPMKIEVNMSFQVLHEKNPGLDENYNFDFSTFRRIGALKDDMQNFGVSAEEGEPSPTAPDDEEIV